MAMADTDRDRKERNYELVGKAMRNFLAPALESWIKRELQKPKNLKKNRYIRWGLVVRSQTAFT